MNQTLHTPSRQDPDEVAALLAELATASNLAALQPKPRTTPARALGLDSRLRCVRPVKRRLFRDHSEADTVAAKELLSPLPKTGEVLHMILPGSFVPLDMVPALLEIIGQKATSLRLATLGFSVANVNQLCRMLDDGTIGKLSVLCSRYFQAASKEIYAVATTELPKRNAVILASRSHAKIMLVDCGKTRWTFEASANLRSCVCVEQATLCNDPALFNFHAQWFDHVLTTGDHK